MSLPIPGVNSCNVIACKYVIVLNHITYVCVLLQSLQTFSDSSAPICNIVEKSLTYSAAQNPLPHDLQNTAAFVSTVRVLEHNVLLDICGLLNNIFDGLKGKICGLAK